MRDVMELRMYPGDMKSSWSQSNLRELVVKEAPEFAEDPKLMQVALDFMPTRQGNRRGWSNQVHSKYNVDGRPLTEDEGRAMFCTYHRPYMYRLYAYLSTCSCMYAHQQPFTCHEPAALHKQTHSDAGPLACTLPMHSFGAG